MLIPRGERVRRTLARRALVARLHPVPPPTPPPAYQVRHGGIGDRKPYGKKKAKARRHRKEVARQHAKERKKCPATPPPCCPSSGATSASS